MLKHTVNIRKISNACMKHPKKKLVTDKEPEHEEQKEEFTINT